MKKDHAFRRDRMKKGIYVLPNLFTTANLFAGFYSAIASMKGMYEIAAIAILIAVVLDGLDGRIARITHTTSKFGGEYDSLCDLVTFGVAPAILAQLVFAFLREDGVVGGVSLRCLRRTASGQIQCSDRRNRQPVF
jgi:CDP-diacylglycerol--serine O-phosphatidyltransferase